MLSKWLLILHERCHLVWLSFQDRERSPISVTVQAELANPDGSMTAMHWMKARGIPKYGPAFQKCILGYMSDMNLYVFFEFLTRHVSWPSCSIPVAAKSAGMRRSNKEGRQAVGMTVMNLFLSLSVPNLTGCFLIVISGPRYFLLQVSLTMRTSKNSIGLTTISDTFDCSDWILYVVNSPRTGSGRGVVQGQVRTRIFLPYCIDP